MDTKDESQKKAASEPDMKDFKLGKPALVCRWRLFDQQLPLENRHMRALGARRIQGEPLHGSLLEWAKQHIEWTLEEGSAAHPFGVLMIIVDEEGRAAMTVGPYEPLQQTAARELAIRALKARREFEECAIAPETFWAVRPDGTILMGTGAEERVSGATSLIQDLAQTLGMPVVRMPDLASAYLEGDVEAAEYFLVSDEHGVVPAADAKGKTSEGFRAGYQKLLDKTRRKNA